MILPKIKSSIPNRLWWILDLPNLTTTNDSFLWVIRMVRNVIAPLTNTIFQYMIVAESYKNKSYHKNKFLKEGIFSIKKPVL